MKVIGNKTVAIKPPPAKLGRKTLQDLSDMGNIDLEKAIKVLKSKGIEVDSNSRIRPLSNELEVSTTEIYKMITE